MSGWASINNLEQRRPPVAHRAMDRSLPRTAGQWSRPGDREAQPASFAPHTPSPDLTSLILVVDDDTAIRAAISEILEMEGYLVITAADGAAALRQIEQTPPALMVLDMRMPGLDGWDVAKALQQRGIAVPTLVMTAAQDARQWAEQIGAGGYLAKPFDLDDLLAAVERLLPG
jgi:CheY-like chemotaxis protein